MEPIEVATVGGAFKAVARRHDDKEALVFERERVTYGELGRRADAFAKGLISLGVKRDDKVAVWMHNNLEWVYALLGVTSIGAVLVPVNSRFKAQELEYVLRQSDSTTLIFQDRVHTTDFRELLLEVCPELSSCPPGELRSAALPLLRNVVCRTALGAPGTFTVTEVMARGERVANDELGRREAEVSPEDLFIIQYTSGTTSFPKGCMTGHEQAVRDAIAMGRNMAFDDCDRIYCPLPFNHVGGSIITLLVGLLSGATVVTTERYEPAAALALIAEERCTAMNGVETIWAEMLKHPAFDPEKIRTLKKGWAIGPPELLRNVAEKMGVARFVNTYGLSEQTANTGTTLADDPLEHKLRWNGKPHRGTEMKVVDPETGRQLVPGEQGEICVRGFNVMKGYYRKPEETSKVIDAEGWLHTGDLGVMDRDGNFRFSGRAKDMLRVGGENVSAMEVEGLIFQHPAVRQVQVVGVPDPRLVEVPMAFVQLQDGHACGEQEIIEFCRGKVSSFKMPRYVRFVADFPKTASGKVQKYKLREEAVQYIRAIA